jgi:hypothetical protein
MALTATTTGRPLLDPGPVFCTLTADLWISFLTLIGQSYDDHIVVPMTPVYMQARFMAWMRAELGGLFPADPAEQPVVTVDQTVRKVS